MKINYLTLALVIGLTSIANIYAQESRATSTQRKKPYWQDVNVVQVNKEYPRTQFMTFDSKQEALSSRFEESK
ncbi:hypothetical protein, partial [Petrimonas sp.]